MKKIAITFLMLFFCSFQDFEVLAHSYTKSSSPAEGEVVTKALNTIEIIFETEIEQMGQLSLSHLNQTITVENVIIEGDTITGHLETPLENGSYEANWKIVGEDGHPIEGTIKFSVELPVQEPVQTENKDQNEQTEVEKSEGLTSNQDGEQAENEVTENSVQPTKDKIEEAEKPNKIQTWLLPIVVGVSILVSFWVFRKDKK